jgi:NADH:ubiquinone oxidoreductase subunit 5 (subunit L)/multisubunit Na+/H+ antiporter MnhA subunit
MLTAFYSFRLLYFVFFNKTNITNLSVLRNVHEMPIGMAVPLMVLCLGSIFSGYFFKDLFVGLGTDFFKHTILVRGSNSVLSNAEFIPVWVKWIPTGFSLFGLAVALVFCSRKRTGSSLIRYSENTLRGFFFKKFRRGFGFLSNKWNFDSTYNHYFVLPFLKTSYRFCFLFIDQYFLKFFGPVGSSLAVYRLSRLLIKRQQSGLINDYAFYMCYFLLGFLFVT